MLCSSILNIRGNVNIWLGRRETHGYDHEGGEDGAYMLLSQEMALGLGNILIRFGEEGEKGLGYTKEEVESFDSVKELVVRENFGSVSFDKRDLETLCSEIEKTTGSRTKLEDFNFTQEQEGWLFNNKIIELDQLYYVVRGENYEIFSNRGSRSA
ncbi:MAG: hypothetical protein KDH96_06910 [Candidatus Riesia sp.]|nr:hypothetical protein [Candidatus Riesia sp.]